MNEPSRKFTNRGYSLLAQIVLPLIALISIVYFSTRQTPAHEPSSTIVVSSEDTRRASRGFSDADFAKHIAEIKKRIPAKEFTIVVQSPFVVIGDSAPEAVRTQSETVRWAVEKLKQDYFEKDPVEILDVWLFKNADTYKKYARELFNDEPGTPYGYYSSSNKALVMNISTGGGTLVHEIVHPFVEANFPECPSWFNEGLGSLYEQSGEVEGHIYGFTNWRLPGLQKAIRAGVVPSFKTLMAMDRNTFYNQDKGTNYGQSRYLLYYLQQEGLLVRFYKEFYANRKKDPTGYQTLQTVLGERDIAAFQKRWEKFVLGLREGYAVRASD